MIRHRDRAALIFGDLFLVVLAFVVLATVPTTLVELNSYQSIGDVFNWRLSYWSDFIAIFSKVPRGVFEDISIFGPTPKVQFFGIGEYRSLFERIVSVAHKHLLLGKYLTFRRQHEGTIYFFYPITPKVREIKVFGESTAIRLLAKMRGQILRWSCPGVGPPDPNKKTCQLAVHTLLLGSCSDGINKSSLYGSEGFPGGRVGGIHEASLHERNSGIESDSDEGRDFYPKPLVVVGLILLPLGIVLTYKTWRNISFNRSADLDSARCVALIILGQILMSSGWACLLLPLYAFISSHTLSGRWM
jgi:hypothetical protein